MNGCTFVSQCAYGSPLRVTLVSRRCEVSGVLGSLVTAGRRLQRHSLISMFDTHRLEIYFRPSEAVINNHGG